MGFIIYYLALIVNPMGRILVRWKSFRNNLEMLCHLICNWPYRAWDYPGTELLELPAQSSIGSPGTLALTGGKVAKQKKFSSAYQLVNIQIFCAG